LPSRAGKTYVPQPAARKAGEVRRVEEKMNVSQGKLNIGLNAPSTFGDDSYPAALVYNGVLGAFPHSKLFQNVREKASLAYYASSRYDGHKGMIMIQTGIEPEKYEQSLGIILDQLEQIRAGQISGEEMEQTKTMIASQLREFQDSSFDMIAFDFNSVLSGRPRSLAGLIADISRVDHGAVQRFAQTVNPDTIYFLRSQEEKRDEQGNV
jgi:predicted Zn-dependent peptidase